MNKHLIVDGVKKRIFKNDGGCSHWIKLICGARQAESSYTLPRAWWNNADDKTRAITGGHIFEKGE